MARLEPYFPKSHGKPRVDDRRDLSESAPHGFEPGGKKGDLGRLIGRTKGGMNTKLHAVTDANGRPPELLHDRWSDQRLYRRGGAARRVAESAMVARRPRL
jgi:hypothetical protein